jgi:glycosyltransferase involved in cell wall biosynthesis
MKQVWILNHYALEPGGAGGTRHFNLATYLPEFDWQATIIAASTELNTNRQRLTEKESHRLERQGSIPFLWIRTPKSEGNGVGRMKNMLSFSFRVLLPWYTKKLPKPDAIIGSSVHPFAAFSGALLARRHKVPFIFEVRDLWPQTLIDFGRLKEKSLTTTLLRKLEKWLYVQATKIIVLLPLAVDYIAPLGISKSKVVWIPNGVDLALFPPDTSPPTSEPSPFFTLMYFGAHGQANGLDTILDAMKLVSEEAEPGTIQLRMIGSGPLKQKLILRAKELGLKNILFEQPIPKKDIHRIAAEADAFIITVLGLPKLYRYGISMNKLFDYMAAARPVIIATNSANNPIKDGHAGITVPADTPDLLAKAILEITAMSNDTRKHLGDSGRKYVEDNHDFSKLAGMLAQTLNDSVEMYG